MEALHALGWTAVRVVPKDELTAYIQRHHACHDVDDGVCCHVCCRRRGEPHIPVEVSVRVKDKKTKKITVKTKVIYIHHSTDEESCVHCVAYPPLWEVVHDDGTLLYLRFYHDDTIWVAKGEEHRSWLYMMS